MIGTMKNNSVLYTPRQVATFYSIRKDTLLYYDRIGLFQPEIRKENGYRYYSASQLAELDTILTLRDLDFPIPAIKEALKDLNPGSFVELMEREEESIRRKIDAYESLMKVVQRIRRGVSDASKAEKGRLYISQESSCVWTRPGRISDRSAAKCTSHMQSRPGGASRQVIMPTCTFRVRCLDSGRFTARS